MDTGTSCIREVPPQERTTSQCADKDLPCGLPETPTANLMGTQRRLASITPGVVHVPPGSFQWPWGCFWLPHQEDPDGKSGTWTNQEQDMSKDQQARKRHTEKKGSKGSETQEEPWAVHTFMQTWVKTLSHAKKKNAAPPGGRKRGRTGPAAPLLSTWWWAMAVKVSTRAFPWPACWERAHGDYSPVPEPAMPGW
jgi:hypothetical protein